MPVRIFCRPAGGVRMSDTSEIGVDDLAERSRDRRRSHQEHVRRAALARQRLALGDAEAVLFVDHDEAEIGEADCVLHESVGTDHDSSSRSTFD